LASELRAQAADEVAALREELAVLRTNLQILFDTDLEHRPALETERTTVRAYSDWDRYDGAGYDGEGVSGTRVSDDSAATHSYDTARTEENPIIDVPEVGVPAGGGNSETPPQQPAAEARGRHTETYRGTHRRASDDDALSRPTGRRRSAQERSQRYSTQHFRQRPESSAPQPASESPRVAGSPTPAANSDDTADSYDAAADDQAVEHAAVLNQSASGPRRGRHHGRDSSPSAPAAGSPDGTGPRRHGEDSQQAHARHSADTGTAGPGPQTGGQSVSDLLARLQTDSAGRRRHRRED
jgi:hypothetical protein